MSLFHLLSIISLLCNAYGLGEPTKEFPNPLPAPQAGLMASITSSIFYGELNYTMIGIGMGYALLIFLFNLIILSWLLKNFTTFRMPVLAAAIGLTIFGNNLK